MAEEKKTYKFVCTVCGYEVEVDTPELPEDYVCPVCGVGPDEFELVEEQLVGTRLVATHSSVQGPRSNFRPGPFSSAPKGSLLLAADPVCCEFGRPFVSICNI